MWFFGGNDHKGISTFLASGRYHGRQKVWNTSFGKSSGQKFGNKKKVEKYFLQTLCAERVLVLFDFKT